MRTIGSVVVSAALAAACSPAGEAPVPSEDVTGAANEGLSNHEKCATARADVTLDSGGSVVSPTASYGTPDCAFAYLVDILSYQQDPDAGASAGFAYWAGSLPTTEAVCVGSDVRAYVWDTTAGGSEFLGANSSPGVWRNGRCYINPSQMPVTPPLTASHKYRYAVSARMKDNSGRGFHTVRVGVEVM